MSRHWHRLRREDGQALILFAVVSPVLFAMMFLAVDGANLFVQRRTVQNAADAAALAIARVDLDPYGAGCLPSDTYCKNTLVYYSNHNNGPIGLTASDACGSGSPPKTTNCYDMVTPYKGSATRVKVTLTKRVSTFFGRVVNRLINPVHPNAAIDFDVKASAVASVTPGGTPIFAYAMQLGCDSSAGIAISGGVDNERTTIPPNKNFPGLWSNQGILVNGQHDTTDILLLGSVSPYVTPPPDACSTAKLITNDFIPTTPTYVPQRCTVQDPNSPSYRGCWPRKPPTLTCGYTESGGGTLTIGNNWGTDPRNTGPGVYCAKATKGVAVNADSTDLRGYTFVGDDIDVSGDGDTFGCKNSQSCTVMYARNGNIVFNHNIQDWSCTPTASPCDADIYAPFGQLTFGGAAGGSTCVFRGLMEAYTIQINCKGSFQSDPSALVGGDPQVSLDE
jgi:hypothetical protein